MADFASHFRGSSPNPAHVKLRYEACRCTQREIDSMSLKDLKTFLEAFSEPAAPRSVEDGRILLAKNIRRCVQEIMMNNDCYFSE